MKSRKNTGGLSWAAFKAEWRGWLDEKAPMLIFGCKFGGLILLLYLVLALPAGDRLLYGYLKANAWVANGLLGLTGQQTHLADEVVIQSSRFSMGVRRGCDAVEPTWLVCAAMIAFPVPWRKKIVGMAAAVLTLQVLNLVRLVTLYFIGAYLPAFFDSAHLEIWPTVFILAAITLFLFWKNVPSNQARPRNS